jgi:hypothetical protein
MMKTKNSPTTLVFTSILGFFFLISCNKDKDEANSQLVASAGNDVGVQTGQQVTLNGNGSVDLLGNLFEYSWSFISKPASSNASLTNNTTSTPAFTPDIQGKYRIELTVASSSEDRDTVTVFAFQVNQAEGIYESLRPGPNVGIRDFAVACNYLFATCEFTEIGGIQARKIARYDGSVWSPLGCGLEDGSIFEMIEYKGELYVTGQFTEIGCISANNIARWNCEMNIWDDVEGGLTGGSNPFGFTLTVYNDELYVGGQFEKAGDVNATNIAKWNGTEWSAVGNITGGAVRELVVYNQNLIAGGAFNTINGTGIARIASYNGSNWSVLGAVNELELKSTGIVRHMAVYKDVLYISGDFSSNNETVSELITWNGIGFDDFGRAFSLYQNVIRELAVIDGILYIGGTFRNVVGSRANNVLQWNGESWRIMKEGTSGSVLSIESFGSEIYLGGEFDSAGGNDAENIAIWSETQ